MKFSNVDKLIVAGFAAWGAVIAYSTSEMLDIFSSSKNGEKKEIPNKNNPV